MRILLTNDDGVTAPGLEALLHATRAVAPDAEIRIVAPSSEMSQCGHRITTATPLRVATVDEKDHCHAVEGSPADCVRIALFGLNFQPTVVLSGINRGGNLGQDLYVSGTAAAAREAAYHGLPALALSHYMRTGVEVDWAKASALASAAIDDFLEEGMKEQRGFWNVNLPHLDPQQSTAKIIDCPPSQEPLPVGFVAGANGTFHYEADYQARKREEGSDIDHCFGGSISRSWVPLHG